MFPFCPQIQTFPISQHLGENLSPNSCPIPSGSSHLSGIQCLQIWCGESGKVGTSCFIFAIQIGTISLSLRAGDFIMILPSSVVVRNFQRSGLCTFSHPFFRGRKLLFVCLWFCFVSFTQLLKRNNRDLVRLCAFPTLAIPTPTDLHKERNLFQSPALSPIFFSANFISGRSMKNSIRVNINSSASVISQGSIQSHQPIPSLQQCTKKCT